MGYLCITFKNLKITEWIKLEGNHQRSYSPTSLLKQSHPRACCSVLCPGSFWISLVRKIPQLLRGCACVSVLVLSQPQSSSSCSVGTSYISVSACGLLSLAQISRAGSMLLTPSLQKLTLVNSPLSDFLSRLSRPYSLSLSS